MGPGNGFKRAFLDRAGLLVQDGFQFRAILDRRAFADKTEKPMRFPAGFLSPSEFGQERGRRERELRVRADDPLGTGR